ncbi:MAG: deoxyhypusine synthase [Nanoarchaeota archaeon]
MDKESIARENILKKGVEVTGVKIKGYDFNKGVNYSEIVKSFSSTGFQATQLSKAIEIVNKMRSENVHIFLGYTSNMVSSGLRDIFRFLVEHKKVNIIVTTTGGIEEDFIKCMGDFILGDFKADGKELRENAVNRIGNIFVPNSRYVAFEKWIMPILEEVYQEQKKTGKIHTPSELIWKLGEKINNKESIYYWAWKNQIPVYCPAIMDGSLGDMIYFFKYKQERDDFMLDSVEDGKRLNDSTLGLEKSGVIILGSGVIKHSILNAHLYRNGADYAVYINTAQEFDGSDAGATPDEAVSWGKLRGNVESVKVYGDATILFPILVAESFAKK